MNPDRSTLTDPTTEYRSILLWIIDSTHHYPCRRLSFDLGPTEVHLVFESKYVTGITVSIERGRES